MCHHGRPVQVFLVGHHYMVQCGPVDGPYLSGIDLKQLPKEGKCGEVPVGIGVELPEGACHLRLHGHRGPGDRMSKPETTEHGGAPGVQCLCAPLGEPACSHCEVEACRGEGIASTAVWYTSLRRKVIQQHPTEDTIRTQVNYKPKGQDNHAPGLKRAR